MNRNPSFKQQKGVALILSLLLMFVLVILGVAGYNSTHVQERSAGNIRLQTLAFEAASAGANNAINFFDEYRDDGDDDLCGAIGHAGWDNPATPEVEATQWRAMGDVGGATLRQRMYCLADKYPCSAADETAGFCTPDDRPVRSQLFVLSRGEVTIDGDVVAQRDVEVRLEVGNPGGGLGDGCTALCFPACDMGTVAFPTSNAFQVDGNGQPAITAGCQDAANEITGAIRDNRIGNYHGGIEFADPGSPWDSVTDVNLFRLNLQTSALAAQAAGQCQGTCFALGTPTFSNNGNTSYGTVGDPQITYVEGNASFGGGISGAGILVVNGNLTWNGTPNFKGLILILGGTFNVIGGGTGGDHAGSVVLLNAKGAIGDVFGTANADFTGGGTALYRFDCNAMWAAHNLLDTAGKGMWSPECDVGPETVYQAGPPEMVIASWRENLGWRQVAE